MNYRTNTRIWLAIALIYGFSAVISALNGLDLAAYAQLVMASVALLFQDIYRRKAVALSAYLSSDETADTGAER